MDVVKIAAVMRAGEYSPNHIGQDAAILDAVAARLRRSRCRVTVYSEKELCAGAVQESVVVNMCRQSDSAHVLQHMEESGALVLNSGFGIENCLRGNQTRLLASSDVPFAQSIVVDTDEAVADRLRSMGISQCWVKRADHHSQHAEDVTYSRTADGAQDVLTEFFRRGFRSAVIQRHVPGKLVKFYGVEGSGFFYWYRPYEPEDPDPSAGDLALGQRLRLICTEAAQVLGVAIYGGECIEDVHGNLTLIDFNDWPSFAPCRDEATVAIAKLVLTRMRKMSARKRL